MRDGLGKEKFKGSHPSVVPELGEEINFWERNLLRMEQQERGIQSQRSHKSQVPINPTSWENRIKRLKIQINEDNSKGTNCQSIEW